MSFDQKNRSQFVVAIGDSDEVYGLHSRHVCMPSTVVWSSFRKHGVKLATTGWLCCTALTTTVLNVSHSTDAVRYRSLSASIPFVQRLVELTQIDAVETGNHPDAPPSSIVTATGNVFSSRELFELTVDFI